MNKLIEWQDLGEMPYSEAWALQDELRAARIDDKIADRLLFVEHPKVFTLGKRDCSDDFLTSQEDIAADGIEVVKSNRGGRVTYHGPGQIVGYVIFKLSGLGMGIRNFVKMIEEISLSTLDDFGISAQRDLEHPGIWCGATKIVAIGLNVTHDVTQHGFALNVNCDLTPYKHIVACGIKDRGVTSMQAMLNKPVDQKEVKESLLKHFGNCFNRKIVKI